MDSIFKRPSENQEGLFFEKQKLQLLSLISKSMKKIRRKIENLSLQLEECLNWPLIQHKGELIKAYLPQLREKVSEILVWDWKTEKEAILHLNPDQSAQEQMVDCFKRAKKLERGVQPLGLQLEKTQNALEQEEEKYQKVLQSETPAQLELIKGTFKSIPTHRISSKKILQNQRSPLYIEFISETGFKIWVGRNAKANDQLTFRLSNGRDWWMHIRECPGSHIVIRLGKAGEPDDETLKDAMQLALHYSKARDQGEGEVLYTQRKYISRLGGGKAGQVQVSKHKTALVRFDPIRFQKLKERGLLP